MSVAAPHFPTVFPPESMIGRSKAEMSAKARTILENILASGRVADGTHELVVILRGQNYSISNLLQDVSIVKLQTEASYASFFDNILALCIEQTSLIHESAIENMLSGFCELTVQGQVLYANPSMLSLLPDCEGKQLANYFPKHIVEISEALNGSAAKRVYRLELEAHDHPRPVLAEFGLVCDGVTAYAFISDLTPAQDVERRTHDTAPFAILKLDTDHRITYANEPASKLLGGTPESVIGRDAASLVQGPKDVEALEREYEKRRRGETSEYELNVKPINLMPPARVRVRSFPESDPDGHLASTLVTLSPVTAELTAQRILDELTAATEAEPLFERVLDHLRPHIAFDAANLSIFTGDRSFSRILFSDPVSEVNDLWIFIPEAFREIADGPKPYGDNLKEALLTRQGGDELHNLDLIQKLLKRGLRGWYSLAIRDCDQDAVLTLFSKHEGCYDDKTTVALDKVGARQAIQGVLRLDLARERDFQLRLLKSMARTTTDRDLAHLVVTELVGYYGWQNVSIFKVNIPQRQFELLDQAKALQGGFELPAGYCQPLDKGFLGEAFREGAIRIVADASKSPDKERFVEVFENTRSEMCVPIRLQGQVVWILNLEDRRPHAFEAPEKAVVERLMHELEPSLERALSSALLDEVLDAVPDAVVITDLAGMILKCNLSARDMLGGEPKQQRLASFFADGSEGAAAVAEQTSYPVKGTLVGLDRGETNVLIRSRIPSVQYNRRVVFLQDSDKLNWQAETRQLMQALAHVASQIRVPLSLVSSFVRQIGRQAIDQAPRLADMANRAVEQLGRVELTYNRVIDQVNQAAHPELVEVDELLATVMAELPRKQRDQILRPLEPVPPVWADRSHFKDAVTAMLAYLLRIGDADAPIAIRTRVFGDAVGVSMFKATASAFDGTDGGKPGFALDAADEALARCALDEPGLHQFAASHHGLFRRRRTAHGETLRLVLRIKEAACMIG